jgi:MoaA/NifB/PqqE/SkfB family radical SAM enzyme
MVDKNLDKTCCLPWNHLATHPNGFVTLCCQARMEDGSGFAQNQPGKFMNMDNHDLLEILNSQSFRGTREKMYKGIEPHPCTRCYEAERRGEWNKREYENKRFNWQPRTNVIVGPGDLEFIELRLGNVCNLACVTCNSISSSKWRGDELAIANELPWFKEYLPPEVKSRWFEDEQWYARLAELSANVKRIYINGGEPFLVKAHKRLLADLVAMGVAENIELEYSTNTTILPTDFLDTWKHFKRVTIMLSVDDLGERNEWIRWPSKWTTTNDHLHWYRDNQRDNMFAMVCQTINSLNVFHVADFVDYCHQLNLHHTANFVFEPSWFSAATLTDSEKEQLLTELKPLKLQQLEVWLSTKYNSETKNKQQEFIGSLNKIRNISSNDFARIFARDKN